MKTRVDKYLEENKSYTPKRVSKNTKLYEEIKRGDLENLNIGSNAKIIAENDQQINLDKIKEILEKNYNETPKKRSMKFDIPEEEEIELEKTREYDINAILEQAREEKEVDYEKERLKKVRDTQYDILKNLELEAKNKAEERTKEELLDLINTINLNEVKKKQQNENEGISEKEEKDLDPLDILSDLKGEENTVVAGAKEFTEEMKAFETNKWNTKELTKKEEEDSMDNSFYTNSMAFNKKDFADFEDLNDDKNGNIVIKVLIVIVFLAIIAGLLIFLNEFLNLGWF